MVGSLLSKRPLVTTSSGNWVWLSLDATFGGRRRHHCELHSQQQFMHGLWRSGCSMFWRVAFSVIRFPLYYQWLATIPTLPVFRGLPAELDKAEAFTTPVMPY